MNGGAGKKNNHHHHSDDEERDEDDVCNVEEITSITFPAEKAFENSLALLIQVLINAEDSATTPHLTAYGAIVKPFGVGKLKVLELLSNLFLSETTAIVSKLAALNLPKHAMVAIYIMSELS